MPLDPAETVIWSGLSNHTVGPRAVGGKLYLTDRRLLFRPHILERRFFGGEEWSAEQADLAGFDVQGADAGGVFAGSLRKRLRVALANGETALFVVWRPVHAARELSEALGRRER